MVKQYAKVILSTVNQEIDRIFDYAVPLEMQSQIEIGARVLVPFGVRNNKIEGYVMEITDTTEVQLHKIKFILSLLDEGKPMFTKEMITLAYWMKEKYFSLMSQCLQTMMPAGIKTKSQWSVCLNADNLNQTFNENEKKAVEYLAQCGGITEKSNFMDLLADCAEAVLTSLKNKNVIKLKQKTTQSKYLKTIKLYSLNKESPAFEVEKELIEKNKRLESQRKIIEFLSDEKSRTAQEIVFALQISEYPLKSLLKKGFIQVKELEQRSSVISDTGEKTQPFVLTREQQIAVDSIKEEDCKEKKRPVLIHGVTGSGKTEIYMQVIDDIIKKGKQAIVLVPEISLTPQTVNRFVERFGNQVSVTHSRMSNGERYDQWKKARDKEISIMIGPRSALFAPFPNLGVVIIDEEHETSYRSDVSPKYDAREVAAKLCEITGSLLLLGSATPDIITYYKAKMGEFVLVSLKQRAKESQLPQVEIVDMRAELEEGNYSVFSKKLHEAVEETICAGNQTMLFINRRGFSTFVSCRQCGHVMTCDDCNISYTYHSYSNELICHYCGKRIKNPSLCPACGSKYIKYFGTGTQKIEEEANKLFPKAAVLRMDFDTTTKKNGHEKILNQFRKGKANLLIGTQMIAKGHDFPKVTLVGVMAADLSLNSGDFRAAEVTFQLITQVAGRAGRDKLKGKVLIQTYQPENSCIQMAAKQDYEAFYESEIKIRQQLEYPPFSHIFMVLMTGKNEKEVITSIHHLYEIMLYYNRKHKFQLLGPSPAFVSKVKGEYRWRIVIKCAEDQRLKNYVLYCIEKLKKNGLSRNVYLNLTFNPYTIV